MTYINKRRIFILLALYEFTKICNFFTMYMQILHNINVNSGNISTKLFHTKKGKNMQMNFMHKVAKIGLVASLFAALSLSAAESARSITDMQGVKVSVPEKVEKIAALWNANNEIILALGGMDKVVATTDLIKTNKWFEHIYPKLKNLPAALNGKDLQIEELVKLAPDVIIVSNKNYQDELIKNGFSAVNLIFRDYPDMEKSIYATAEVIGTDDARKKAEKLANKIHDNSEFVTARTKSIPDAKRPKVLHLLGGANLLKIDGTNTIQNTWIKLGGGVNAINTEGSMIEVSAEEIINANPDIIIVGGNDTDTQIKKIKEHPAFSGSNAVKNGKIYGNPKGVFSWDRYGAENVLQILWAAKTIQPDLFKDVDMKVKTKEFYKEFLNHNLSDKEYGYILKGLNPDGSGK